ncbi:hypothetical protein HPB49_006409 [Dermacentor silvarum]|uniref:Uncharacterized protein n=1 Tax=Dermacentor silvarum TaxID=543639 RepID=A0ACB8DBH9_DERSI|nr:hypothetical protein HPB49_006409 [Dermacentor silvarum]
MAHLRPINEMKNTLAPAGLRASQTFLLCSRLSHFTLLHDPPRLSALRRCSSSVVYLSAIAAATWVKLPGDFYEDQFRLGNANSLRPAAPYDADRQRALLEGPFHRAPVQQLSLTCPTNDPAPCSILESCSALSRLYKDYATITWTVTGHLLKNLIDRSTLSTLKNDGPVKVSKIAINQLERLRSDNGKFVFECTALSKRRSPRQPSRLVPSSRTPARATPSASLAGPRAARAATSPSYPSP